MFPAGADQPGQGFRPLLVTDLSSFVRCTTGRPTLNAKSGPVGQERLRGFFRPSVRMHAVLVERNLSTDRTTAVTSVLCARHLLCLIPERRLEVAATCI